MFQEDPESLGMQNVTRSVLWRSFFLETLWNFRKMQNVGFLFCFFPVLKRLYPDDHDRSQAVERHLEVANTHPAMGPLLAGLIARLEHDRPASGLISYRRQVMSALAAYGDRLFWTHLRPLAAVVGVVLSLSFPDSALGIGALLAVYNVPHLLVRGVGFQWGWSRGLEVLRGLTSTRAQIMIRGIRQALSLGLGFATGLMMMAAADPWHVVSWNHVRLPVVALLAGFGACAFVLIRRDVRLTVLIYPAILVATVLFAMLHM
jgi:mannose/fructose/N-acetylgalactosamine-specific phosphotransferase system component IID